VQPFFTYLLRCRDGSYYAGHTDDLEQRIAQHQAGELPGHTASRRPVELVWSEEFESREEALETELQLKRWTRAKKEALIRGDWRALKVLARGPDRSERIRKGFESVRSPFDSGPAGGRPYAQGEREGDAASSRSKAQGEGDAASSRSMAQGEREGDAASSRSKAQGERGSGSVSTEPRPGSARAGHAPTGPDRVRAGHAPAGPDHVRAGFAPTGPNSVRPERSGRAAAAESKGELTPRGEHHDA
jgi:predicted GIY-YIG superfamily endonuclease